MGQLNLGVTDDMRYIVKKLVTPRMRDRLKDEESDRSKKRKRDCSNNLLASDVDKLVKEHDTTARWSSPFKTA